MKNTNSNTLLAHFYLGYNREHYIQMLLTKGIETIDFGHWLAIPSQKLLLVFRHQKCIAINHYPLTA